MSYSPIRLLFTLLSIVFLITACGGGSSNPDTGPATGSLSLQITDAPVDGVMEVNVRFAGVTVKPKDGAQIDFSFESPMDINLLTLTDTRTATLLDGEELPAGEYNWVRLNVDANCDGSFASNVMDGAGGEVELQVPSTQGLQLSSGFVITANQTTDFIIDWDLRKGLTNPQGSDCYKLKPSLRITDLTQHGSIAGTVDPLLVTDASCTSDVNTQAGNVVYIYEGEDVVPDDIDGDSTVESSDSPDPVTTANVLFNANTGEYEYLAAFLSPGAYTAAFTCQGQDDNIPEDDESADDELLFTAGQMVTVDNGETATANF